jgi:serpin B
MRSKSRCHALQRPAPLLVPLPIVPLALALVLPALVLFALILLAAGQVLGQPDALLKDVLATTAKPAVAAAAGGANAVAVAAVAAGNNAFACDLYRKLADDPGNLFFSPFSISAALAMTWGGARGETAGQMAEVLHLPYDQEHLHPAWARWLDSLNTGAVPPAEQARREDAGAAPKSYVLRIADRLWPRKGLELVPSFLEMTRRDYGAEAQELDYVGDAEGSRQIINAWVAEQTAQKIPELIPQGLIDRLTELVLTNAIYFLGDWQRAFPADATRPGPFFSGPDRSVEAPLMQQRGEFGYASLPDLALLELPYAGGDLSMLILLPQERDGLPALERKLTPANLDAWLAALQERSVQVTLPKFRLRSHFNLGKTLQAMGMGLAFTAGADFSGMVSRGHVFISEVVHEAYVDVYEEGTEAAAATGVIMKRTSVAQPAVFRADHPFLFLIRDMRSRGILFLGRLTDPSGG